MDSITVPLLADTNTPWRMAVAYEATSSPLAARIPRTIDWTGLYEHFVDRGARLHIQVGPEPTDLIDTESLSRKLFEAMMTGKVSYRDVLVEAGDAQRAALDGARSEAGVSPERASKGAICVTLRWQSDTFDTRKFKAATTLLDNGLLGWVGVRVASAFALGPLRPIVGPARAVRTPVGEWVNLPRVRTGTPSLQTFDPAVAKRSQTEWQDSAAASVERAVSSLDVKAWAGEADSRATTLTRLHDRIRAFASREEPLSSVAYWCLTLLEEAAGSRRAAAELYGISYTVLQMLGRLSSEHGGVEGRKAAARDEFTEDERYWLEVMLTRVLERVGLMAIGVSLDSLDPIDLSSLPSIAK